MHFRASLIFTCGILFELAHSLKKKHNEDAQQPKEKMEIDYQDNVAVEHLIRDIENEYAENLTEKKYWPEWSDLDTRPMPGWYDKAKIGIFLHWGVYSVPSFKSEWFWYYWRSKGIMEFENFMDDNYPPSFSYQDFAPMFTAEFFDPNAIANLTARAGAKYVVLTAKHHDGFTLFPSTRSFSWNSVDTGPHRDLVGDLAQAVRQVGLKFGVYYSLYEWYNPLYLADKNAAFSTRSYITDKVVPEIEQLVNDYRPSVLWADGEWEAQDSYWNATEILSRLYNDSPVKNEIVVNDRWGIGIRCNHGDFFTCDDRYNPGQLQNHKWENAFTLDRHTWGYNRKMNLSHVLTMKELLREVLSTVSCGGNVLINVGPTKEGTIAPIFEERLLQLGDWLAINGEAIYDSSPWTYQNDSLNGNVWYTCTKVQYQLSNSTGMVEVANTLVAVFASFLDWPENNTLFLGDVSVLIEMLWEIELLGNEGASLRWKPLSSNRTAILLPRLENVKSKHAWTLKFRP